MPDLKVTIVQSNLHWEDVNANLAMFDEKLDTIQEHTDLIILPEMFSTGFSMRAEALAEPMSGKAISWMREKSQKAKAAICGSVMIKEAGQFYNRLIWMSPDGSLITYNKKHLFRYAGEEKVFTAGNAHSTLELNGWKIRPFICYDLRFPTWTRNLNLAYDLAIFTANWPARRSAHWRTLLRARAIENQSYVIGVNRVGTDGNGLDYDGYSTLILPDGEVRFEVEGREAIQTVTLQKAPLEEYRKAFPAWMDADTPKVVLKTDLI